MQLFKAAELGEACQILFDSRHLDSRSLLSGLQPDTLRSVFRRRAMETHPDRAAVLGVGEAVLRERFESVSRAYHLLAGYLKRPRPMRTSRPFGVAWPAAPARPPPAARPSARARSDATGHHYRGKMPQRVLLFGQFAYYSGVISWRDLIDAVCWQRKQRPLIGRLAVDLGLLESHQVRSILWLRQHEAALTTRFAEFALRRGFLTPFERLVLVGRQRRMQEPIGQFFVDQDLLEPEEVDDLATSLRRHNWRFGFSW